MDTGQILVVAGAGMCFASLLLAWLVVRSAQGRSERAAADLSRLALQKVWFVIEKDESGIREIAKLGADVPAPTPPEQPQLVLAQSDDPGFLGNPEEKSREIGERRG